MGPLWQQHRREQTRRRPRPQHTHGVEGIVLLSEGHITQDIAAKIEEHSRARSYCKAIYAPTSHNTAKAIGEYGDPKRRGPAAGVTALLSPDLTLRVRGPAQKLASGHLLHFVLGDDESPGTDHKLTHVIVAYGVSGESRASGARASLAKQVAREKRSKPGRK